MERSWALAASLALSCFCMRMSASPGQSQDACPYFNSCTTPGATSKSNESLFDITEISEEMGRCRTSQCFEDVLLNFMLPKCKNIPSSKTQMEQILDEFLLYSRKAARHMSEHILGTLVLDNELDMDSHIRIYRDHIMSCLISKEKQLQGCLSESQSVILTECDRILHKFLQDQSGTVLTAASYRNTLDRIHQEVSKQAAELRNDFIVRARNLEKETFRAQLKRVEARLWEHFGLILPYIGKEDDTYETMPAVTDDHLTKSHSAEDGAETFAESFIPDAGRRSISSFAVASGIQSASGSNSSAGESENPQQHHRYDSSIRTPSKDTNYVDRSQHTEVILDRDGRKCIVSEEKTSWSSLELYSPISVHHNQQRGANRSVPLHRCDIAEPSTLLTTVRQDSCFGNYRLLDSGALLEFNGADLDSTGSRQPGLLTPENTFTVFVQHDKIQTSADVMELQQHATDPVIERNPTDCDSTETCRHLSRTQAQIGSGNKPDNPDSLFVAEPVTPQLQRPLILSSDSATNCNTRSHPAAVDAVDVGTACHYEHIVPIDVANDASETLTRHAVAPELGSGFEMTADDSETLLHATSSELRRYTESARSLGSTRDIPISDQMQDESGETHFTDPLQTFIEQVLPVVKAKINAVVSKIPPKNFGKIKVEIQSATRPIVDGHIAQIIRSGLEDKSASGLIGDESADDIKSRADARLQDIVKRTGSQLVRSSPASRISLRRFRVDLNRERSALYVT